MGCASFVQRVIDEKGRVVSATLVCFGRCDENMNGEETCHHYTVYSKFGDVEVCACANELGHGVACPPGQACKPILSMGDASCRICLTDQAVQHGDEVILEKVAECVGKCASGGTCKPKSQVISTGPLKIEISWCGCQK